MSPGRRIRGVALLNALVILVIVAGVATRGSLAMASGVGRTEMMIRADQARHFALSAEALARTLLEAEWSPGSTDHLGEAWAEPDRVFEIESGTVTGRIVDLQGRFNLNSLVTEEGTLDPTALARLSRLMARAGQPGGTADRVAEWVLAGPVPVPGALGDAPYLARAEPFRRPGRPMAGPSELRQIEGIDAATFARLAPWVTALPEPSDRINVNTAPLAVLAAHLPGIPESAIATAIATRDVNPFANTAAFRRALEPRTLPLAVPGLRAAPLSVASTWFLIEITAFHDGTRAELRSLVQRSDSDGLVTSILRLGGAL